MLKQVTIKGFKGITDLTLNLDKINVLIGVNSSGKTTILQALDLLVNCVFRDVAEYLKDKNWKVSDIKSQISKSPFLSYKSIFEFEENGEPFLLIWDIKFKLNSVTSINLIEESIYKVNRKWEKLFSDPKNIEKLYKEANFLYTYKNGIVNYEIVSNKKSKFPLSLNSSGLKIINFINICEISLLKEYLEYTTNFGTLITQYMYRSSKEIVKNIGVNGKQLAAFIKQMTPKQKENYIEQVHSILNNIKDIFPVNNKISGMIELFVNEKFGSNNIEAKANHMGDGTLRILAIIALLCVKCDSSLLMLDEIENGMNPYITTKIVELFYEFISQTHNQLLLTTNSSLILDNFKSEDIICVYRNQDGGIEANRVFNNAKVKEFLEYMNPGEIWINFTERELLEFDSN